MTVEPTTDRLASERSSAASREAHYEGARSWVEAREAGESSSRRVAWIVASIAVGVATLEALALIALAPFKTVVPYTILVDRTTGYTEVLEGTHPEVVKADSALTKSLLAQYVIARESFEISSMQGNYRKVALWSDGPARSDYLAAVSTNNPASPVNQLPRDTQIEVVVSSVMLDAPGSAQVRFTTNTRRGLQGAESHASWVARLHFHFRGEPTSVADRLANPLGFAVGKYVRDQEALPDAVQQVVAVGGPAYYQPAGAAQRDPEAVRSAAQPMATPAAPASTPPASYAQQYQEPVRHFSRSSSSYIEPNPPISQLSQPRSLEPGRMPMRKP